jgi:hypothetical protein
MTEFLENVELHRLLEALRGERSQTRIAGYDDDGKFVTLIPRGGKLTYKRLQLIVERWDELSWQDSRIRDAFVRIMTSPSVTECQALAKLWKCSFEEAVARSKRILEHAAEVTA